ncbi:VirD4-like conjugal transfer protein, CD1115 family [Christensenella hongkongensis]|uniref:TrsK-like protein n=1 Tax=Christensenella hongkongensis TaxID=270498 RepID=A0A0M2NCP3_9FIRM|nr:type IV secretory system conjugative DNA transfer family protein [Christensenella hongkongensis]KKI49993.1 TrsK-like protein [Christensenella hongkongensis]TCW27937.1 type IV secretion system protein VirD4 [Christensenella hongkongensis]
MDKKTLKSSVIMWGVLLGGMLWFAVKLAMSYEIGITFEQFKQNFMINAANIFYFKAAEHTAAFVVVVVVIWLVLLSNYLFRAGLYMHGKEHGSAGFANLRELQRKYVQDENIILSQNLSIGLDMYRHQHNLNILVVGGSGSGKGRGFCIPGLISNTPDLSYVCSDPKGEALRSTGHALEKMGYVVRVLNLIDMKNSMRYNPFRYLRKDSDVISLITNFIQNTTPKDAHNSDPFWEKAEIALLQALMFYLWYEAPSNEQNFAMMAEMLRYAEVREKDENHKSPLDMLFEELKHKNPNHIACRQYDMYKLAAGKTAKSILVMAGVSLSLFGIEEVIELTSEDELRFSDLAEKKVALFCITSDCDPSFDWLASMLYTQMFQELEYIADNRPDGRLARHVRFILDEYANISISSGQSNDGGQKVLSTCRSRNFSMNIVIQNIAQLKGLFKDTWENITGCCDVMLYLGGNEQSTHRYVADELSKATIRYDTYGKSANNLNTNINITGRELMTPGEIRELDRKDCIVLIANEKPIIDRKYDLMKHPNINLAQQGGAPPYYYRRDRNKAA